MRKSDWRGEISRHFIGRPRLTPLKNFGAVRSDISADPFVPNEKAVKAVVGDPDVHRLFLLVRAVRRPPGETSGKQCVVSSSRCSVLHSPSIADRPAPKCRSVRPRGASCGNGHWGGRVPSIVGGLRVGGWTMGLRRFLTFLGERRPDEAASRRPRAPSAAVKWSEK